MAAPAARRWRLKAFTSLALLAAFAAGTAAAVCRADTRQVSHPEEPRRRQLERQLAELQRELREERLKVDEMENETTAAEAERARSLKEAEAARAKTARALEEKSRALEEAGAWDRERATLEKQRPAENGPGSRRAASLPDQAALATVAGLAGLCGVAGPRGYVRAFSALAGSALSGLLLGTCAAYLLSDQQGCGGLPGCARALLEGRGGSAGYLCWSLMAVVGAYQWCASQKAEAAGEAELLRDGATVEAAREGLRRPLLAGP